MWLILLMICLGLMVGVGIHLCFRLLRQSQPILAIILGWVVTAFGIYCSISLGLTFFTTRYDTHAPMGSVWGMLALAILVLIAICAGFGLLHRGVYGMSWLTAFALMMTEVGVTTLVAMFSNETTDLLADLLRGGSRDTGRILASFDQARSLQSDFALALVLVLVILELTLRFTIKRVSVQKTSVG